MFLIKVMGFKLCFDVGLFFRWQFRDNHFGWGVSYFFKDGEAMVAYAPVPRALVGKTDPGYEKGRPPGYLRHRLYGPFLAPEKPNLVPVPVIPGPMVTTVISAFKTALVR